MTESVTDNSFRDSDWLHKTLAIFFVFFLVSTTFSIAATQTFFGASLVLFFLLLILKNGFPFSAELKRFYFIALIWIGWLVISALVAENSSEVLVASRKIWLFMIVPVGVYVMTRVVSPHRLIAIFAGAVLVISGVAIFQHFYGYTPFYDIGIHGAPVSGYRSTGYFRGLITFGNFYAVASSALFAYLLYGHRSISRMLMVLISLAVVCSFVAVIFNFGRAAAASMVGSILFMILLAGRRYWKELLGVIVLIAVVYFSISGAGARFERKMDADLGGKYEGGRVFIWGNSLKMLADYPIFGVGLGNFRDVYSTYVRAGISESHKVQTAHNELLNIAVTTGIPGAVIYFILWIVVMNALFRRFLQARRGKVGGLTALYAACLAGSVCFLAVSIVHDPFFDGELMVLLMFFWSVGFGAEYKPLENGAAIISVEIA